MAVKVYRDDNANAVIIEVGSDGAGGMRFNNELRAIGNGDDTISILNPPKSTDTTDFAELTSIPYDEFVDLSGVPLGANETDVVNQLNSILRQTGGVTGNAPVITSALAINVSDGDPVNYTLVATDGVGYEWDSIPAGLSIQNGNQRKLIGTITAGVGVYTPTMTATNYYGQDTETLTITVTSSFANTKSIDFVNQDWMGANAALLDAALGRAGNGSGSGDAWTIHCWFKAGTSNNQEQTIFYFGSADVANGNHLRLRWNGNNSARQQLIFRYGTNNNYLQFASPTNVIDSTSGWHHIMITYDGGTTGSSSGSISDYYSRFAMYIDGALVSTTNSNSNFGITTGLSGQNLRIGRYNNSGYMRNGCLVDEVAVWDSDQSSNIAAIYNSATPHDLSALGTPPTHWWRMGDGDTYPVIFDNVASAHFLMYNMTAADIVNDVP